MSNISKGGNFEESKTFRVSADYKVRFIAFSFDDQHLVSVAISWDGKSPGKTIIDRWPVREGSEEPVKEFQLAEEYFPLSLSHDGKYVVLTDGKKKSVWDTSQPDKPLIETEWENKALFSPNTRYFALIEVDDLFHTWHSIVNIFDVSLDRKFKSPKKNTFMIYTRGGLTAALSSNGMLAFRVGSDAGIEIYDAFDSVVRGNIAAYGKRLNRIGTMGTWKSIDFTILAFGPGPEPYFSLEDPERQEEKIELMEELLEEEQEDLPEGSKNLPTLIYKLSLMSDPERIEKKYTEIEQLIEKAKEKFPDYSGQLEQQQTELDRARREALKERTRKHQEDLDRQEAERRKRKRELEKKKKKR